MVRVHNGSALFLTFTYRIDMSNPADQQAASQHTKPTASETIYSGTRHTVALAFTFQADETPTEWSDLDFRSPHQDSELALQDYLQETFGDDVEIHHENGLIYVDDPDQEVGSLRRYYRL